MNYQFFAFGCAAQPVSPDIIDLRIWIKLQSFGRQKSETASCDLALEYADQGLIFRIAVTSEPMEIAAAQSLFIANGTGFVASCRPERRSRSARSRC
jgi:hypothetical protein